MNGQGEGQGAASSQQPADLDNMMQQLFGAAMGGEGAGGEAGGADQGGMPDIGNMMKMFGAMDIDPKSEAPEINDD